MNKKGNSNFLLFDTCTLREEMYCPLVGNSLGVKYWIEYRMKFSLPKTLTLVKRKAKSRQRKGEYGNLFFFYF